MHNGSNPKRASGAQSNLNQAARRPAVISPCSFSYRSGGWKKHSANCDAERSDPLSSVVHYDLAYALNSANHYDEAAEVCVKLSADDPERSWCLGKARLGQGRIGEAIQILETA